MYILNREEMYRADRYTIENLGVPSLLLMENAGRTMANEMRKLFGGRESILILIGAGNNGGDGLVLSRYLLNWGYSVKCFLVCPAEHLRGDAKKQWEIYQAHGYSAQPFEEREWGQIEHAEWIVDALFGIGITGKLSAPYREIVQAINRSAARVLSVDIPSGILVDQAEVGLAVRADYTYTVAFPKVSAYLYPAAEYYGRKVVLEMGIPPQAIQDDFHKRVTWGRSELIQTLPMRSDNTHKGRQGRALLVGGSEGMRGAPILAANGCIYAGIGLLSLAVPEVVRASATVLLPEATYLDCVEQDGVLVDLQYDADFDLVIAGMGMSRRPASAVLIKKLLEWPVTLVLDADALYFLKDFLELLKLRQYPTVLTPHMGELARLMKKTVAELEKNRWEFAKDFALQYGVYLLLKGPYSILTTPLGEQYVNQSGNSGLAKGGSGDLLSGMIGALAARSTNLQQAVSNAVFAHGWAADRLLDKGGAKCSLTATMVAQELPSLFHDVEEEQNRRKGNGLD